MSSFIDFLNVWGQRFTDFALPFFWQSSLLIAVVFASDFILRRRIRAAVRYSLWFVVFVKLLLPPNLALPTGAAWWLRGRPAPLVLHHTRMVTVNYSEPADDNVSPAVPIPAMTPPPPTLSRAGWMLLVASVLSVLLAAWVLLRWRQIARCVRRTTQPDAELTELLSEARRLAGLRKDVTLRVTAEAMSPAVCGLFKPMILLPQSLLEKLTPRQLRAVLLHELIHLRRKDVWVNCAQTCLQIVYWWHPLLWVANARVRRVREEAVDDAVMFTLNTDAEVYAPTLLEVAKLAFARPLASLGLVGILESRSALRHRIERLLNFTTPRRAGVSAVSLICLAAFTALAVPMGEPPAGPAQAAADEIGGEKLIPYRAKVNSEVFARNIRARAEGTMHTTNDDLSGILASIMDGFDVDGTGERAIHFDQSTGEVRAQNTPDAVRVLDEVVKELNLKGGEHVLNPPQGLKEVLIEGRFYLMKPGEWAALRLASDSLHREGELSPWWELSSADLAKVGQQLKDQNIKPMMSPRIQTSHGIMADMFMGDGTNNIRLECVPYVHDGMVSLTVLARTAGEYAPKGTDWPDIAGHTNCAIFSRVNVASGGAAVLRAENAGADNQLIVLLNAKILPKAASAGSSVAAQPVVEISQLVHDGELFFQLGKIDEAESKFKAALARDVNNPKALYYTELIKQSRAENLKEQSPRPLATNVPGPGRFESTNRIYTSAARQKLYRKLMDIRFDKISFPDESLNVVIRELAMQTQRRNVDQEGINFLIYRPHRETNSATGDAAKVDSTTGQSTSNPSPDFDVASTKINIDPGLKDVRLLDVLEAITKSADHPISYSILDYGIEFSAKGPDVQELHTRTFKVDPNTFLPALANASPFSYKREGGNSAREVNLAVIEFFHGMNVDLKAPKSVFFNERQGTLTIRATDDDLEIIEQTVINLNTAPLEVTVKLRLLEMPSDRKVFTSSYPAGTKALMTGVLTDSQLRAILKAVKAMEGVTLISEGEVTTLSGRQANFQTVDVRTVINGLNASATSNGTNYNYLMTNMNFGTTFDVAPTVGSDGYTIQLKLTSKFTEFLGYDNPKEYVKYDENLKHVQFPLPKYRSREGTTSAFVWDGQTLVLGKFSDESVVAEPNGSTIRQASTNKKNTDLVVLITPTIIDQAGNRVHNGDDTTVSLNPVTGERNVQK